jgi:3-phosphoshikimate 1-carboxyvinyltransferase
MPLPELIEIVPLTGPVKAEITVPGSKSITNRALILAALSHRKTVLKGALWSEDTQVMVDCLQKLGFQIEVAPDPNEFCNRIITIQGTAGKIPNGGMIEHPLELYVGNAGTAARFLSALVCLGRGVYRLFGVPRMHERPQAALFNALRELNYRIDSPNDKLPAVIHGAFRLRGKCRVSIEESSQFASALLLCANIGGWEVEIIGENAEESPYIAMTSKLIAEFEHVTGEFQIEPDASSASYFVGADRIAPGSEWTDEPKVDSLLGCLQLLGSVTEIKEGGWQGEPRESELRKKLVEQGDPAKVRAFDVLRNWKGYSNIELRGMDSSSGYQIDARFHEFWPWREKISRLTDLGDSIMTGIALTSLGDKSIQFTDLGRLRVQECERVHALRTELTRCGGKVNEEGDTLTVYPARLHGAEIETYGDHRMAMCFAILGLKVPGIKIKDPRCVKKTFPNFFQKLAAAPPAGLGVTILDALTRRPLTTDELFAD